MPENTRYIIAKLPGKRDGWAVIDTTLGNDPLTAAVVGTRSKTRREAVEDATDLGIKVGA